MKALVVYNSFSGNSKIDKQVDYINKRLKSKYLVVDCFRSTHPKSITSYVYNNGRLYDLIVAAGGDGTINETINGLMMLEKRPLFGCVPCGTCNDFSKSIGLKKNVKKAMDIILDEKFLTIDVNKINNNYFTYGMAIGCFSQISYKAKHGLKRAFGRIAYFLYIFKLLGKDDSINIRLHTDDCDLSGKYFLLLGINSRYLASFKLRFNEEMINKGVLNIFLIEKKNWLVNTFDFGMFLLFGEKYKHNIIHIKSKRIEITSDELLKCNIDGEVMTEIKRLDITVCPKQLNILIPKKN